MAKPKTKRKKLTKIGVAFRKGRKEYTPNAYKQTIEKAVYQLEELGLEITCVYFSKSSESVYVTFKLNEYNEERLNLTNKNYLGHFTISSHPRYYNTANKTFLTTQVADMSGLLAEMQRYFNGMLADKENAHSYLVLLSNKELDVLRLMAGVTEKKQHFEVFENDIRDNDTIDLFIVTDKRKPVTIISDKVSSDFVRVLLTKGCVKAFAQGCQNRVIVQFTDLADLFLAEYGDTPSDTLVTGFLNRNTFDLWKHPVKPVKAESATQEQETISRKEPTDSKLAELGVEPHWYKEFDTLAQVVATTYPLSFIQHERWTDMLADFISDHLPENRTLITHQRVTATHKGIFYITEPTEFFETGFCPIVISPKNLSLAKSLAKVTIDCSVAYSFELLEYLAQACVAPLAMNMITEADILSYLTMRNLGRQGVNLAISPSGNVYGHYVGDNQEYHVRIYSPAELIAHAVELFDYYKLLGLWETRKIPTTDITTAYISNALIDLFDYATPPYVINTIMAEDKKVIPMVTNREKMWIQFYSMNELIS